LNRRRNAWRRRTRWSRWSQKWLAEVEEKEYWQKLIQSGGPFDADKKAGILGYCMRDVDAADDLLEAMAPKLSTDLQRVLLRGRYTVAIAETERRGIPIDAEPWRAMLEDREPIQLALAQHVNRTVYPLYDKACHFKLDAFGRWLEELGLAAKWKR